MRKRLVNHCTIELAIIPDGPILIKAIKEGEDPSKSEMEFVETYLASGKTIYLPGSSLKEAIRAHLERIVRIVGSGKPIGMGTMTATISTIAHTLNVRDRYLSFIVDNARLTDTEMQEIIEKQITAAKNSKLLEKKTWQELTAILKYPCDQELPLGMH